MITKAKEMGIWVENDAYEPSIGDWVLYDWQDYGSGDNKGTPDHVGMVTSVSGKNLKIIEGNYSDSVRYRTITINAQYIRGYVVPKLGAASAKPASPIASAPSKGVKWAGTENPEVSFSPLENGQLVQVCDTIKSESGNNWYYVYVTKNRKYGFVYSKYVKPI